MLKQWMCNPDLDSIHVEEKYKTWIENLRTDRYTTVYSPVLLDDHISEIFRIEPRNTQNIF